MAEALLYLPQRIVFRIRDFFHHWYWDGTKWHFHYVVSFFEHLDRTLALRMTARHFGEPLYGDYTAIGYVMGFLFRSIRVVIGAAVYACLIVLFAAAAIVWFAAPPFLLIYALW